MLRYTVLLAMLASSFAKIPSDFSCGLSSDEFCLACPKGEQLSTVFGDQGVECSCKSGPCTVFTADGKPSTIEAYNKAVSVPGNASIVDEDDIDDMDDEDYIDDNDDDYIDDMDDVTFASDTLAEEISATGDAMKKACWDAAPDGVDKTAGLIINQSQCTAGGNTWPMNEADAAKFNSVTSSLTESVSSSSSSSATTESTTESTTTTTSAQMAAFAFAPLCVLLAMA
mmetsp:Transcript_7215/g.19749  ORF Transcript_7215/g.19749 Transcript_7215/m.19749 type:complete len:227 (+) Transcript_7215:1118-1798(+)